MTEPTASGSGRWRYGCAALLLVLVLGPAGLYAAWQANKERRYQEQLRVAEERAEEVFEPILDKLAGAAAQGDDYDLDKTIRVIHELDLAMEQRHDLEGYLETLAVTDYRGVAPEVLEARSELLETLLELYAKQVEADDQAAMWEVTSELLLSTMSVVSLSGEVDLVAPAGELSIDRRQAASLLADLKERRSDRKRLVKQITALETELFNTISRYGEVHWKYVQEWDRLSLLRDRAYLAAHAGHWEAAEAAAAAAVAAAPHDREAHLMQASALIELGSPETIQKVDKMLTDYLDEHPESSAPALLLLGMNQARSGRVRDARLSMEQAAAYYPKQAEQLTDMLDPYKRRSFLRQSREGAFIVERYMATMVGAGFYSPDLQLARLAFDAGDDAMGRSKVLDHFARRRSQGEWDFVLSDISFCHELLGPDFWSIFPESSYLDLHVSPSLMGGALNLSVENRGPTTLHNATLVLALHMTDMFPGDYVPLAAEKTLPAVLGHDTTEFGSVTVEIDVAGAMKGMGDIVEHRAILISDEAVTWVDTEVFKIAEADAFRRARTERRPDARVEEAAAVAQARASLSVDSRYGADGVLISLPRELAALRPIFRLKYAGKLYDAAENMIEGDHINLHFRGVDNFDAKAASDDLELIMATPLGELVLAWTQQGDLTWDLRGVSR
jgi:hypothetical protein